MKIAVIRGGGNKDHMVSIETGKTMLDHLRSRGEHNVIDLYINKDGAWHNEGMPTTPGIALRHVDLGFNAMHGEGAEDGNFQIIFEGLGVPLTGSGKMAAALSMNKELTKNVLRQAGVRVPSHIRVEHHEDPREVAMQAFKKLGGWYILKPIVGSSSRGVNFAKGHREVPYVLEAVRWESGLTPIIVEEYVRGREVKIGVVDNFRGQKHYALLPIEVEKGHGRDGNVHSPEAWGDVHHGCHNFTNEEKREAERVAILVHKTLGLEDYSMTDMIMTPRGPVVIEVNPFPPIADRSMFSESLLQIGSSLPEFLDHLIRQNN